MIGHYFLERGPMDPSPPMLLTRDNVGVERKRDSFGNHTPALCRKLPGCSSMSVPLPALLNQWGQTKQRIFAWREVEGKCQRKVVLPTSKRLQCPSPYRMGRKIGRCCEGEAQSQDCRLEETQVRIRPQLQTT